VTICVATISSGNMILGAADRMLTAGDIQFQPPMQKIVNMTPSIATMVSGDMALQAEIFQHLNQAIRTEAQKKGVETITVSAVAYEYARIYSRLRLVRSAQRILAPLGLTAETFIAQQKQMAPELVNKLASEMLHFEMPEAQTIFAGLDAQGSHLFVAIDGVITCEDAVGFAAIGAGAWHAESQLMFARYAKFDATPRALYLTYVAKKRAETAPGVGQDTDMFVIGPEPGSYSILGTEIKDGLEKIYQANVDKLKELADVAEQKTLEHVQTLIAAQPTRNEPASSASADGTAPVVTERPGVKPPNPKKKKRK
jgi:20S proteasome alpha/beta subunit